MVIAHLDDFHGVGVSRLANGFADGHDHQIAFFHNDVGLSEIEATTLLGGVFLVSVIGRIGAGILTDRMDPRYVLAAMVGMNVTAWVYVNFAPITSTVTALPFVVLYGIPFGATVSIRPVLMEIGRAHV